MSEKLYHLNVQISYMTATGRLTVASGTVHETPEPEDTCKAAYKFLTENHNILQNLTIHSGTQSISLPAAILRNSLIILNIREATPLESR